MTAFGAGRDCRGGKKTKKRSQRVCSRWRVRKGGAAIALVLAVAFAMGEQAGAEPGLYAECKGRLVHAPSGAETDLAVMAPSLARADYVLFGERHGVKEHAASSACVLGILARNDRPVTLVMEMLRRADQSAIDAWRRIHPENPAGLGAELEWWKRGWPAFDNWLPLLDAAFALRAHLLGGDLPEGEDAPRALTTQEREMMDGRLGKAADAIHASWQRAMFDAHCGLLTPQEARRLAPHQIRRDLSMADVALAAGREGAAVLVQTGRGHSRKDRSLYAALDAGPDRNVVSIGAFANQEEITPLDRQVHDFLWIVGSDKAAGSPCLFRGAGAQEAAGKEVP